MKRIYVMALAAVMLLSSFAFAGAVSPVSAKGPKILKFDTMVGVPAGLTGIQSQGPLRGINGGGIAWMIADASGELRANGHLEITVQGLVLAAGANAGSNPSANFRGVVSCVTDTGAIQNVPTDPFPATLGPASAGGGNATIEADLTLPQPCIAPIIFVTNGGGTAWFAATGL